MTLPVFGLTFQKVDNEARPVIAADLSVIGIVGPASGADTDLYPLDTPVKIYSNDTVSTGKLGTSGYLADAINGINDQLATMEQAAICVIVRTPQGTNEDAGLAMEETIAGIMGSSVNGTGVHALLKAPEMCAVTPRLIIAPGYTGLMATSLNSLIAGTVGSGYLPGVSYALDFSGGGTSSTIVQATGHAVANPNGEIHQADYVIDSYGAFYDPDTPPTVTVAEPPTAVQATMTTHVTDGGVDQLIIGTVGTGYVPGQTYALSFAGGTPETPATGHALANENGGIDQADLHIDTAGVGYDTLPTCTVAAPQAAVRATVTATVAEGANPVCATLPGVLETLVGHAIVESSGTSEDDDDDWRETMNSQRLIPIVGGCKILDPDTAEIVVRPFASRVAGIAVRRDFETGAPGHSWANQPVYGIVGPARSLKFSLVDGANEGQQLLANNIGILVRGETGSDFAISSGGFIFIGTDNAGDDPLWQFYSITRMRDFIHLSLLRVLRVFLGRQNITGHTIQAVLNTIGFFLRDLQAEESILGYKLSFTGSTNSAEEIRLGHLTVGFAAEEPPVLRRIRTLSARYRPAIDSMVSALERQLSMAA